MSRLQQADEVIAVLVSDIHLSHKPPIARSAEPNWYIAMSKQLWELKDVAKKHHVPIICAGDVFDSWNSPPELISFAIRNLPPMYSIPGQHDLPHHNYEDMNRSAYWTMVEAGIITNLKPGVITDLGDVRVSAFPWGTPIEKLDLTRKKKNCVNLLVAHAYIWTTGQAYEGASRDNHFLTYKKELMLYDAALFGDNHKGFKIELIGEGGCHILNNGTFFARHSDEIDYEPSFGLLHKSGKITRHYMETAKAAKFLEKKDAERLEQTCFSISSFVNDLKHLKDSAVSFEKAVDIFLDNHDINAEVRSLVLKAAGR